MPNPLVADRNVEFLLYEVFHAEEVCRFPAYADHSRETFDLVLQNARKFAREVRSHRRSERRVPGLRGLPRRGGVPLPRELAAFPQDVIDRLAERPQVRARG